MKTRTTTAPTVAAGPGAPRLHGHPVHGFTLVEVLVATVILGTVAMALTQTLLGGFGARRTSARWMRATELASEGLERIRAGAEPGDPIPANLFERIARTQPVPGYPNLERIEVVVTWQDRGPQSFTLTALIPATR